MPDKYIGLGLWATLCSLATAFGMVLAFKPRVVRLEKDVEKKLDEKVFVEVKAHIDTKFTHQEGWLKSVDEKLDVLIERRAEERNEG